MGSKGRAVVIVLGIVAALGVVATAVAMTFQIRERGTRLQAERKLLLAQAENKELESELAELQQVKDELQADLAQTEVRIEELTATLTEERDAKATLAQSVDARQREIDRLGKDLEQIRSDRQTLADEIAQLKDTQSAVQEQLTDLEAVRAELEERLTALSDRPTVELDRVVVSNTEPDGNPQAAGLESTHGQVIVVNREYDFIVMNLGTKQGMEIGRELHVLRDDQILGRVKVEKVYDELSAAAILPESRKDDIREGDIVRAL